MASAAALANTLGVPASARVTTKAQHKHVRPTRGGCIRAMAEADESPVFRAWDQATNSNKRTDIKKIMIIGAGPIVIGQACEFDYSGTQACKSLRWDENNFKLATCVLFVHSDRGRAFSIRFKRVIRSPFRRLHLARVSFSPGSTIGKKAARIFSVSFWHDAEKNKAAE